MSKITTDNFIITILAEFITFLLVIIAMPMLVVFHFKRKLLKKKETLLQKCLQELIERKIDFMVSSDKHGVGCFIENIQEPYFFIDFDTENKVFNMIGKDVKVITTMEGLLKLKPFVENDK
ncbi:hypothetical protein [Arcicella lustrica]|uniref:Uncharacterized protein n=1 Tax=Arcicella lustrica TaxID=2984196 RepID=A0ABU5SDK2_9BACT|nr:hypothetical protein [Arcicella sp. DC25W]MEA5425347.1 hypothetical protein [Arcicella sp. DC25W]